MIPLDRVVAGQPQTTPIGHSAEVLSYFTAPRHRTRFWVAMWTTALVVQLVALRPVFFPEGDPLPSFLVMYHIVGFSFTGCGLIAWRRRPDSGVGLLMTASGFLLYAWPVLGQLPSAEGKTVAEILEDLWGIPLVALLLTHHSAGRLSNTSDRLLLAPFVLLVPVELVAHLAGRRGGERGGHVTGVGLGGTVAAARFVASMSPALVVTRAAMPAGMLTCSATWHSGPNHGHPPVIVSTPLSMRCPAVPSRRDQYRVVVT